MPQKKKDTGVQVKRGKRLTKLKQLPTKTAVTKKSKQQRIVVDVRAKENTSSKLSLITRQFKDVSTSPMPHGLSPMLATLSKEPFNDKAWLFEIKWDGYRTLAYVDGDKVQLRSRNNLSFNQSFWSCCRSAI